jgi:glycosyltransferase involved in cell wall biosynthesis
MRPDIPDITVLMSCYNAERWLVEAVESVIHQTYKDFEFVIVDDGSVDNTLETIQRYEKLDSRVRVISKLNTGLADSLNVGLSHAKGKWIARIDADDLCEPLRLETQLGFVQKNPQIALLGTDCLEIDEDGNVLMLQRFPTQGKNLRQHLTHTRRFFPHSSAFYCTATARELGGYRPQFVRCQDWDLWLRFAEKRQIACLDQPLIRIRKHNNQHSSSCSDAAKEQFCGAQAAIVSYLLRDLGLEDPSAKHSVEWDNFLRWVTDQIDKESFFERREIWTEARNRCLAQKSQLLGKWHLAKYLMSSGYGFTLIKEHFIGLDLAERLTRAWLKTQQL